ncbi:MAG TPA: acyltransferase, partial [Flavobacteriales bacterium]|nr:acyltransferase [Flavobacteriales bacterium]
MNTTTSANPNPDIKTGRLLHLDYLRGLSALGIMMFHYCSWTMGRFESDSFLGRFGVYGVSIFYVLSGITLFHVYKKKLTATFSSLVDFFKKRFLRIFPLYWVATISTLILLGYNPGIFKLGIHLSGLFGFVKWHESIAVGSWSIGNELVFYAVFPFILFTARKSLWLLVLISASIFCLYVYFAFFAIDPDNKLPGFWRDYVNPLNQLFLFLGGFLIGFVFQHMRIKNLWNIILLIFSLIAFIFYPVNGEFIHLVSGTNRMVFTALCFLICFGFYKAAF